MRRRKLMNQINVVPFIDVILVLLIVFMIATPTLRSGEIELPSVGQALTAPSGEPIEVTLHRDGRIDVAGTRNLDRSQAVARIRALQAAGTRGVVVAADRRVAYEQVIGLIGALHAAGIRRVGLAAREGE